jgi:hypothetical protein
MVFKSIIVYEDRDEIRTSRWSLDGISTKDAGQTDGGWLWYMPTLSGDNLTITLYAAPSGLALPIASGVSDISTVDDAPIEITLAEQASSGVTGSVWVHSFTSAPTLRVPILTTLVMDADIDLHYARSDETHMSDVYDSTVGYAAYCADATAVMLRKAASLFVEQMGGYGAEEDHNLTGPDRLYPIWSSIVAPEQMKDAATYYACWKAFMAADESDGEDSMLYRKALDCKDAFDQEMASLSLVFDTDGDEEGDEVGQAIVSRPERL